MAGRAAEQSGNAPVQQTAATTGDTEPHHALHRPESRPESRPPLRRDTASSKATSGEPGADSGCRICRSEATPEEPLFYPCKCAGSIKFVHQECLVEWLAHSRKKHCELCKTPFRFTKLYDATMPAALPWSVFVARALLHLALVVFRACRALLVAAVWLVLLPCVVRWAWRWMFWLADAGWARESYMRAYRRAVLGRPAAHGAAHPGRTPTSSVSGSLYATLEQLMGSSFGLRAAGATKTSQPVDAMAMIGEAFASALGANATHAPAHHQSADNSTADMPPASPSILSSWTYVADLTSSPHLNRIILDIFEGQLITCVVIVAFILVFLIREWVVQQQPLVNLDDVNNAPRAREGREGQDEEARQRLLRLHANQVEQARQRMMHLHESQDAAVEGVRWIGWEALSSLIDSATEDLRDAEHSEEKRKRFLRRADLVTLSILAAERSGVDAAELMQNLVNKLRAFPAAERELWKRILIADMRARSLGVPTRSSSNRAPTLPHSHDSPDAPSTRDEWLDGSRAASPVSESSSSALRPPMPARDSSSRAAQIQRVLEEADGVLAGHGRHSNAASSPRSTPADPSAAVVGPHGRWLAVSPPGEQKGPDDAHQPQEAAIDRRDTFEHKDEMPIANAGPDAKINITLSSKGKGRAIVPEPDRDPKPVARDKASTVTTEELRRRLLEAQTPSDDDDDDGGDDDDDVFRLPDANPDTFMALGSTNEPQHANAENPQVGATSAVREEFERAEAVERENERWANEAVEQEDERQVNEAVEQEHERPVNEAALADAEAQDNTASAAGPPVVPHAGPNDAPPTLWQRLVDWFWGDIQAQAQGPAPMPMEERIDEDQDQEAPFVPVEEGRPVVDAAVHDIAAPENDPEVVAAAQQAGLDAEAIEDAEDLEGIFELIGFQGPLVGLLQTSCFCCILVSATVYAAVGLPYVWGKLVLSFLGAPMAFLVKTPLQVLSFVNDIAVDLTLLIFGWSTVVAALITDHTLGVIEKWIPGLAEHNFTKWISDLASSTAASAGYRLQNLIMSGNEPIEDFGWNAAFLGASVHAHASLVTIKREVLTVLDLVGGSITALVETISAGSVLLACERLVNAFSRTTWIPARVIAGTKTLQQYLAPVLSTLGSLRSGSLTFPRSEPKPLDPTLVYWSNTDRSWAVLTGYVALAAIAAIYVALDANFTRTQTGQKTEKLVRDSLRQAGGVLKVILIISIEMLVFPLYCGLLLDIAFLPLFQSASVASRWAFALRAPYTFCFAHWFVGTCYMFHFALFVGMCRKILRKGVLWFIRDPDDPTFHPVRDVLERNVTTQLRKIAFSALVYGALVILCLGGVIWCIGKAFRGIFPIHLLSTEPFLEFPFDLLVFAFLTPILFQYLKPSTAVNAMYAWWLKRCARCLRLSHFMFDERRKDEEGRYVRQTWASLVTWKKPDLADSTIPADRRPTETDTLPEVYFKRDGKYVLTPCNDQYRPPKPGEATLHVEDGMVYIAGKDGKKNEHFATVYVPPLFRLRVTLFMLCLWTFSAMTGLCVTLLPLCFGRMVLSTVLPKHVMVNDIYPYSIGAYFFGSLLYIVLHGGPTVRTLRTKADVGIKAWTAAAKKSIVQAAKCAYVYGFVAMLPLVFALLLQFYFILPLHTYLVANIAPALREAAAAGTNSTAANMLNATVSHFSTSGNRTESLDQLTPTLADHAVHVFSDYALGFLYLRIAIRAIISTPTSRAAEAIRRITADGYLNPDARLATRFFIVPITLLSTVLLTAPLALASALLNLLGWAHLALPETIVVIIHRYSYPITAGWVVLALGSREATKATARWRARIRDELYLVGERLHNFGEKKPPVGSKSVIRKER